MLIIVFIFIYRFTELFNSAILSFSISFFFLRIIKLNFESRSDDNRLRNIDFVEYLSYLTYFPLISLGPISSYRLFVNSELLSGNKISSININFLVEFCWALLKLTLFVSIVGFVNQFSIFDRESFYYFILVYLNLYLLFSSQNSISILFSKSLGITIEENFNQPLCAKNITEFWQKWHITLTDLARQLIYEPVSLNLARKLGRKFSFFASQIGLFVTFLIIGLWHDLSIKGFKLGLMHSLGLMTHAVYKKFIRRKINIKILSNPCYKFCCWLLTFVFVAQSMRLF
jgi:membrane protein involved in D-alanine export